MPRSGPVAADATRDARLTVGLLIAVGVVLCAANFAEQLRPADGIVLVLAVGAGMVGPVRRRVAALLDRLRAPSPRLRWAIAVSIAVTSAALFLLLARLQDRSLLPSWHDEESYLVGARQIAGGRLWYPPHPCPDFFDTFYVVATPVYASIYFPGTALMNAAGVRLGLATWCVPVAAAGIAAGMMYLVFTELMDGVAGLLAALMYVGLPIVGKFSVLVLSAIPMLLLALATLLAWLGWRKRPTAARALALGAAAGWAAIVRPIDAAIFAVPLGVAILLDLRRLPPRRTSSAAAAAAAAAHVGLMILGAAPFLAAQLALDRAITGSPWVTPHEAVTAREFPGVAYGWRHALPSPPRTHLAQKRQLYDEFYAPILRDAAAESRWHAYAYRRLPAALRVDALSLLLLVLLPAGFLRPGRAWVPIATFPLFFLAYALYPAFMEHYAIALIPAVAALALGGARSLERAWPRAAPGVATGVAVLVASACGLNLYREARMHRWDFGQARGLGAVDRVLRGQVRPPAVVLFHYRPGDPPYDEPVYNIDVPYPDAAPVIRAHDLGDRDAELFGHYARTQPDRVVYRFDRSNASLTRLGTARELADRGAAR